MTSTSREAEAKIRAIIADADLKNEKLTAFREELPAMRMSDLIGYMTDPKALLAALGIVQDDTLVQNDVEYARIVSIAAIMALKDEIDQRFPIPEGTL